MIKENIEFCYQDDKIIKKQFNIIAIRFSLYSSKKFGICFNGFYAQIVVKVKNDDEQYKHLLCVISTEDLLQMFEEYIFKKCIIKKNILQVFNEAINGRYFFFIAKKYYFREKVYRGEKIVYYREIEL